MIACAALLLAATPIVSGRAHRLDAQVTRTQADAASIDLLVRHALEDRLAANDLPDADLVLNQPRIAISEDAGGGVTLTAAAVPQREGYDFYLVSPAAARAEADKSGKPFFFVIARNPTIDGDSASVSIGADLALPSASLQLKLCCCVFRGEFRRMEGRWTFSRWAERACA